MKNFSCYWIDILSNIQYANHIIKERVKMDRYEMANKLEQLLDSAETAQIMKDIPGYEGRYAITPSG
jgi:hypothetical protein